MWLSIFLFAFLLAAAYLQTIQGLTSAAVNCVCAILSIAIAFATYQYVAQTVLMKLQPDYAYAGALFGTFIVPFAILRIVLDMWIPRANLVPMVVDRAVGGAFAVVAAVLVTGMLAVCIQLVPWGTDGFLGFSRFDPDNPSTQRELWLKPDRAVVWAVSGLSSGVFSGAQSFADVHPDYITEIGSVQSLPRGVRRVVPSDAVSLRNAKPVPYVYRRIENASGSGTSAQYEEIDPDSGKRFLLVTLQLGDEAADSDDIQRYTPASIRLVGEVNGVPTTYTGMAAGDKDSPSRQISELKHSPRETEVIPVAGMLLGLPPNNQVDVVFEHAEGFVPQFVEYKMGGRVPLSKADIHGESAPLEESTNQAVGASGDATESAEAAQAPSGGGGRVSGVRFKSSHFGDGLPLTITKYLGDRVDLVGDALVQGHLQGKLAEQDSEGGDRPVKQFKVPQGKVLLQLNVDNLRAGSTFGRALNWSVQTVENYLIEDDQGKQHQPVGKYAIADVGGDNVFEVLYFPEYAESGGRFGTFSKIKSAHLKGDYQLVYLFLVDPGARVLRFSTGRNTMDLERLNLVAH